MIILFFYNLYKSLMMLTSVIPISVSANKDFSSAIQFSLIVHIPYYKISKRDKASSYLEQQSRRERARNPENQVEVERGIPG